MPFKTVIVKGLGKIKFPGSMSDETIEASFRNLDMSEAARMQRAREQGFDVDMPLYHETTGKNVLSLMEQGFDLKKRNAAEGESLIPQGVFLKSSEKSLGIGDEQLPVVTKTLNTKTFRDRSDLYEYLNSNPEWKKLFNEAENLDIEFAKKADDIIYNVQLDNNTKDKIFDPLMAEWRQKVGDLRTQARNKAKEILQSDGYDSLKINFDEGAGGRVTDTLLVFDPANIRSVNAAFNPDASGSPSLLASAAPAAIGLGSFGVASQEAQAGPGGKFVKGVARLKGDKDLPDFGYRGGHTAPVDEDYHAPLSDMTQTYPSDIYSSQAARYYGHGDDYDELSFQIMRQVRGKPDAEVTMYRAVPESAPDEIYPGDWVTINPEYAKEHAEMLADRGEAAKIIEAKVPAKKLRTDGNSPHEFGYTGAIIGGVGATFAASQKAKADPRTASVTGTIEGPAPGREGIAQVADFLDRYDNTNMGELLGGTVDWLRKLSYDDRITFVDRLKAALDFM